MQYEFVCGILTNSLCAIVKKAISRALGNVQFPQISRAEHTANMNQYESTKAAIQDFVHNTCVNMRCHKAESPKNSYEKV